MNTYRVVELLGDGISAELSASVHAIAQILPAQIVFDPVDLSLENRSRRGNELYDEAVQRMQKQGVAIKYPTTTLEVSPNKVLRDRCGFTVIHRPVCTIPGIENNFKKSIDIDIVRMGTGGTYEDSGRRIGGDIGVSLRVIERKPSLHAARFAFKVALLREGGVVSASKYTIQRAADGLFEESVRAIARDYPTVPYRAELFDALLAGLIMHPERYQVIVTPNEYGDFLSDAACGLIGSIGLGDSASYAFNDDGTVSTAMFDPSGGTAPDIAGQDVCNPTAAIFALASLLRHVGEVAAGHALRAAAIEAIAAGEKTADIGGSLKTSEFTRAVARRFEAHTAAAR